MANIVKEDVIPSLIPNTTMKKGYVNGVARAYEITPCEGYVLRDKANDEHILDEETGEPTGVIRFNYASMGASCPANYDFTPLQVTDEHGVTHTAYGAQREFFARLASEVDADQIFGGGDNDTEVM